MALMDMLGKTITGIETQELGYSGDNAWSMLKLTFSDDSVTYLTVDNPSCMSVFYGVISEAPADEWNRTGDYADLKSEAELDA